MATAEHRENQQTRQVGPKVPRLPRLQVFYGKRDNLDLT